MKFAVSGLGNFGLNIAKTLYEKGNELLAIKELIPENTVYIPKADFIIKDSDILIIMGEEKQLQKINSL